MIEVVYPGRPVPWARVKRGRRGTAYTPQKQREHRENLALAIGLACGNIGLEGPVSLHVRFDYAKKETRILISEPSPGGRDSRPDLDNLLKQVLEALELSGVVRDDAQVTAIHALKVR